MAYNKTLQKAGKANKAKDMGSGSSRWEAIREPSPGADWGAAAYTLLEKNGKKISCRGSEL
jgi:hypothetical protein